MLYPQIREITRAGAAIQHPVKSQRDLVALSLRIKPAAQATRPSGTNKPLR